MGLDGLLRDGIQIINRLTSDLQVYVHHYAWVGQDGMGDEDYADSPHKLKAIVEPMHQQRHEVNGRVLRIKCKVTILEAIPDTFITQPRDNPIDHRDKIVLPDGSTGPIVENPGMLDPTTNKPYFAEILLGEPGEA